MEESWSEGGEFERDSVCVLAYAWIWGDQLHRTRLGWFPAILLRSKRTFVAQEVWKCHLDEWRQIIWGSTIGRALLCMNEAHLQRIFLLTNLYLTLYTSARTITSLGFRTKMLSSYSFSGSPLLQPHLSVFLRMLFCWIDRNTDIRICQDLPKNSVNKPLTISLLSRAKHSW